jgi:hypothetical protein
MFAAEGEEGDEGTSVSLMVVLALLASPGALASLFMINKYSTLAQWLRGIRGFNPYRASIPDEYFFVMLSMTVTGLMMVLRWNKLFPDRRDFWNLAVLPIPIRDIFLANLVALASLAVVLAIDLNAVASLVFPAVVTMSDGTFGTFFWVGGAHLAAVVSASLFSFFAVFALVGVLLLVTPARWLRAVTVAVRMVLVVVLLTQLFGNLFFQLFAGRLPGGASAHMNLLPSVWFLGVYERAIGFSKLAVGRPLLALAAAVLVAMGAYALCYRRHFLRLAESFDTLGANERKERFGLPDWLRRRILRSPFEAACDLFALKVLARSERHVMLLGAYWGIGLVLCAGASRDELPLLVAFFAISGLRLVFDMPASLGANWTFRVAGGEAWPAPRAIARRFLLLAVGPVQLAVAVWAHGWAWERTVLEVAWSGLAIEFWLREYSRIPFTYRVAADTRQLVIRAVLLLVAVLLVVPGLATWVRWASSPHWRFVICAGILFTVYGALRRKKREPTPIVFEERAAAPFELLKLA